MPLRSSSALLRVLAVAGLTALLGGCNAAQRISDAARRTCRHAGWQRDYRTVKAGDRHGASAIVSA